MKEKATVLIVDDVAENITVLAELLGDEYEVLFALNGADALTVARESPIDLILLDVMMPGMDGYAVCRRLKAADRTANIPIIFVTAKDSVEDEAVGLTLGAIDYITKPYKAPIVKVRVRSCVALKQRTDLLAQMAMRDGLTGLANRRQFDGSLCCEWRRSARSRTWLSLILLDIDHFKMFNDRYGHPAGDTCLRRVAARMAESSGRPGDLVARWGGEEFAILLPGTGPAGARRIADDVRRGVRSLAIEHADSTVSSVVTVSAGVACVIPTSTDPSPWLISAADQALYEAKALGRDRADYREYPSVASAQIHASRDRFSASKGPSEQPGNATAIH